jgi:hypothetical protein
MSLSQEEGRGFGDAGSGAVGGLLVRGGHVPFSTGILLLVGFGVVLILLRLFRGPREPRGIVGWLRSHFGRGLLMVATVMLVAAINPPRAVGIAANLAINVGVVWYLLLLRQRRG